MTTILHIDSSARAGLSGQDPHGSHTRRLTAQLVRHFQTLRPDSKVVYRDVGVYPPKPVSGAWIHAAFTPDAKRTEQMRGVLRESDDLVDELIRADLIIAGVPMYNFSMPAQFKAYIDNIVRVGRTFGFDRSRQGDPYWPMLSEQGKRLVIVSSRGDYGYDVGGRIAARNHVEPAVRTAFAYLGITDTYSVAAEYDEFGGERLAQSLARAEAEAERLAAQLAKG